jgi:hypothetical protein
MCLSKKTQKDFFGASNNIFAWCSTIERATRVFGRNLWVVTTLSLQLRQHSALGLVSRSQASLLLCPQWNPRAQDQPSCLMPPHCSPRSTTLVIWKYCCLSSRATVLIILPHYSLFQGHVPYILAAWSISNQLRGAPVMCGCGGSRQKDDCNQVVHSTSCLVNQPWGVPVMCGCQCMCNIVFLLN